MALRWLLGSFQDSRGLARPSTDPIRQSLISFGENDQERIGLHQTFIDERGPRERQGEPNKAKKLRTKLNPCPWDPHFGLAISCTAADEKLP